MTRLGGNRNRRMGAMGDRVWAMTGNVARWIRRWRKHNGVETIGGRGKRSWGSIGTLMQSDVKVPKVFENERISASMSLLHCFLDNFVPECTEVMLQSRKSIAYVELVEFHQNLPQDNVAKGSASHLD